VFFARKRGGFTLIELLVVVSILALLIGILMPSLRGARRGAKRTVCASNLRGIGQAMRAYLNDNRDILPVVASLPSIPMFDPPRPRIADTLRPYLEKDVAAEAGEVKVFQCPADVPGFDNRPAPNTGRSFFQTEGSSYRFNVELYWLMRDTSAPDPWKTLKPTTLYNLVRDPRMAEYYRGQPSEEQIHLLRDYQPFHGSKGSTQPINFLYVDGHVSDLER